MCVRVCVCLCVCMCVCICICICLCLSLCICICTCICICICICVCIRPLLVAGFLNSLESKSGVGAPSAWPLMCLQIQEFLVRLISKFIWLDALRAKRFPSSLMQILSKIWSYAWTSSGGRAAWRRRPSPTLLSPGVCFGFAGGGGSTHAHAAQRASAQDQAERVGGEGGSRAAHNTLSPCPGSRRRATRRGRRACR